ncbi:MAG: hypothetical protein NTW39_05995 [Actinobacteria bacterium]|nr:hypothetical protein [Actinomycetota bacterium]
MMKSRAVFAAGAVFLSAALAASFFTTDDSSKTVTKPLKLKPSQVLTWDCEYPEYKPESIMIYCGDGGAYIDKINWKSWNQDGASGAGEYYKNLCEPDCADGKIVHAPVSVRLSELTPRKGKYYLRTLDMSSITGKDFLWGESGVFDLDVMEFIEHLNWD